MAPNFRTRKSRINLSQREHCLLILGIIFCCIGVSQLITGDGFDRRPWQFYTYLPAEIRGGLWFSSAFICFVVIRFKALQRFAWASLIIPPIIRITSFLIGFIMSFIMKWDFDIYVTAERIVIWQLRAQQLNGALAWFLVAWLIYKLASWQDPPDIPILPLEGKSIEDKIRLLLEETGDGEVK